LALEHAQILFLPHFSFESLERNFRYLDVPKLEARGMPLNTTFYNARRFQREKLCLYPTYPSGLFVLQLFPQPAEAALPERRSALSTHRSGLALLCRGTTRRRQRQPQGRSATQQERSGTRPIVSAKMLRP